MKEHLMKTELDVEIFVIERHLKTLKPRSALRRTFERQLKAARLARMMLDLQMKGKEAA